ncbi:hypothetical protein Verru16b_02000 [Lacunisphaera limnophila]|uniref:Glycosyltransferase RgtA/B/C/D-like domain-containing protein n=1 Tax=Lacunisphaera limnophila TaxID=1838286 RepID=A0A1D8AVN1_9BACT|nr:hypothetical protein [Lacunisphaera limnophila]AOS44931.1 hypothetical protein Verru16b_02000 [Lacunisphaera limnophila]
MSPFPLSKPPLWLQTLLLMLLCGAGVAVLFGRWGWADWSQPNWLEGDPVEVYARVRIAGEQPFHALFSFTHLERLGAPFGADWSAYPVPDRLVFVLTGLVARLTGLIAAIHLAAALITTLNAASFYLCARWLRCRWEWAAALATIFAFSTYNIRWGITLSFSQTFLIPPLLLIAARAARPGPAVGPHRGWLVLAAGLGLWLGQANPYVAFFAGIVAGGGLILSLLRRSPGPRLLPLLILLGTLVTSFGLSNHAAIASQLQGSVLTNRGDSALDLRRYALRPADWFVPPADHRVPALAAWGRDYQAARTGPGEFFYNYLGLAGLAGLALLLVQGCQRLRQRRWSRLDPLLGLAWILIFGVAGGLNAWLGAAGLDMFRASTRIGIYALPWALFAAGTWLSRHSVSRSRLTSVLLALFLALVAVWEQTPPLADRTAPTRNFARWQAVADLTARLEQELPPSTRVFQLPVVAFPEAGRTGTMPDYDHFLPLFTSSSLHFSYGPLEGSPALRWMRYVSRLPGRDLVAALEQAGFGLIWLDRRAYRDEGDALAAQLSSAGVAELAPPAGSLPVRLFGLTPAANPVRPDLADPRLNESWDPTAAAASPLLALGGWYPLEQADGNRWRWAQRSAVLGAWHNGTAQAGRLHFRLGAPAGSVVVLRLGGREIWRGPPDPALREIPLPLAPGLNSLEWELIGRTFRPGGTDPRELGFMVENLSLSVP